MRFGKWKNRSRETSEHRSCRQGQKRAPVLAAHQQLGPSIGKTPKTGNTIGAEGVIGQDIGASSRNSHDIGSSGPVGFGIGATGRAGPSIGESTFNSESSSAVGSSLQRSTVGSSLSDSTVGSSFGGSSVGSSLGDSSVGSSFGSSRCRFNPPRTSHCPSAVISLTGSKAQSALTPRSLHDCYSYTSHSHSYLHRTRLGSVGLCTSDRMLSVARPVFRVLHVAPPSSLRWTPSRPPR